jgi:hypothetical protein
MGKYRNIFFSEAIALIEPKLCINHWKVLYKCSVIFNGSAQKLLNLKNKQQTIPKNRFKYTQKIGMLNVKQSVEIDWLVNFKIYRAV